MKQVKSNNLLSKAAYFLLNAPKSLTEVWRKGANDPDIQFVYLEEPLEFPGLTPEETLSAILRGKWENNGTFVRLYRDSQPTIYGYNDPKRIGVNLGWAAFMLTQNRSWVDKDWVSAWVPESYLAPDGPEYWASEDAKMVVEFIPQQTDENEDNPCWDCCLCAEDGNSCKDCSGQHLCKGGWAGVFKEVF